MRAPALDSRVIVAAARVVALTKASLRRTACAGVALVANAIKALALSNHCSAPCTRLACVACNWLAMAAPDSPAAASFSSLIKRISRMSDASGNMPCSAIRSVRIRITEFDDTSISLVVSATSAHSIRGLKNRREE